MFHYFISLQSNFTHSIPVSFNSISVSCLNQTSIIHLFLSLFVTSSYFAHTLYLSFPPTFPPFFTSSAIFFFSFAFYYSHFLHSLFVFISLGFLDIFSKLLLSVLSLPNSCGHVFLHLHSHSFSLILTYISLCRAFFHGVFDSYFLLLSVSSYASSTNSGPLLSHSSFTILSICMFFSIVSLVNIKYF